MLEIWQFYCAVCRFKLTEPLTKLTDLSLLRASIGDDCYSEINIVPEGFFIGGKEAVPFLAALPDSELAIDFCPLDEILFNVHDLRYLAETLIAEDCGCCGYSGRCGLNVFCANNHAVGTQITECCQINYARIPFKNLLIVKLQE